MPEEQKLIEAYVPKKSGDLIASGDWNVLQIKGRQALQQHDHSGTGDNASPIGTSGIQDNAVVTSKIKDRNITDAKIQSVSFVKVTGQLTVNQIADKTITGTKLADNAVTNIKINDVDASKITGAIKVSNGNVGVGTASPSYKLDVNGNVGVGDGTSIAQDIDYRSKNGYWQVGTDDNGNGTNNNQFYFFDDKSREYRLTIQRGTGNVGIGTTSPLSKLSITPSTTEAKITLWDGGSTTDHFGFGISNNQLNYHVSSSINRHVFYATGKNGNGTELMTIQGNGNVGIGTGSPTARLTVSGGAIQPSAGNSETSGIMFPRDIGGGSGDAAWIRYYARTGESTTLEIGTSNDGDDHIALMPSGNVGIGTTTPSQKLEVNGNIKASSIDAQINVNKLVGAITTAQITDKAVTAAKLADGTLTGVQLSDGAINTTQLADNAVTNIKINDVDAGKITGAIKVSNGNLGIGTTSPLSKLSITPGTTEAKITLWDGGSSTNHYGFGISGGQLNYHVDSSGAKHVFYAGGKNGNGTELMTIQGNGNVGIGTGSPTARLTVSGGAIQPSAGNSETSGIMFPRDIGGGSGDAAWIRYYARTGESTTLEIGTSNDGDDHIALMPSGNVGIGTTTPSQKLEVNGNIKASSIDAQINVNKLVGAITTAQITDKAVTAAKLADGTLTGVQLSDGAISTVKLANNAVTDAKINDVDAGKITGAIKVSNGNLGIGTESPNNKLDVRGQLGLNKTGGNNCWIQFWTEDNAASPAQIFSSTRDYRIGTWDSWSAKTNWNEILRITGTGNVGIGTESPNNKLDVRGQLGLNKTGGNNCWIQFWTEDNAASPAQIFSSTRDYRIGTWDSWSAKTNWNEILRITGTGNVGIGTESPTAKLSVSGGAIQPSAGNSETSGIMFPKDPGGGGGDAAWIRYYARTGESTTLEIGTSNDGDDHIALMPSGNVGIGINNPTKGRLHVEGAQSVYTTVYGFLSRTGSSGNYTANTNINYSIYASERIMSAEFNAFSDERIKEIVGFSDADQDLATLEKIEIVDYHYKDKVAKGDKLHKKVIGQQVAQVFPQVVDQVKEEVVPDIMQKASMTKGLVHLTDHGLAIEEEIQIITAEGKKENYRVKAVVDKDHFELNTEKSAEEIFVYGRQVNDFHVVDYEGIAMLNVSATQALSAKVKEQENVINKQQQQISILIQKVEELLMNKEL